MAQQQVEARKKELEQSSAREQNTLKSIMQDMKRDLQLNQNFFLGNNVDHKHQKIIPKKIIKKPINKNYSPTKVKPQNFLTNISYNRLKPIDFDNVSFIIDCILIYCSI